MRRSRARTSRIPRCTCAASRRSGSTPATSGWSPPTTATCRRRVRPRAPHRLRRPPRGGRGADRRLRPGRVGFRRSGGVAVQRPAAGTGAALSGVLIAIIVSIVLRFPGHERRRAPGADRRRPRRGSAAIVFGDAPAGAIPLVFDGRTVGGLNVTRASPLTPVELKLVAIATAFEQERAALETLQALQRVTDAALAYLPLDELLIELLNRITEILRADTAAFLLLDETRRRARGDGGEGHRGGGRAGRPDPGGARVRGADRGRAAADHDRGRRPRRHPQPDPARARHPLAAGRAAAGRGRGDRRAARRHAHPARVHRGRRRAAPARRRPRRDAAIDRARLFHQRGVVDGAAAQRSSPSGCRVARARARRALPARRSGAAGSAATGTTRSRSPAAASRSWSAT